MKHTKYTAIGSLVFTAIPFISAMLSEYMDWPLTQATSYKVIMFILFSVAWVILLYIVNGLSEDMLRKLKLIEDASKSVQGYWLIEYKDNPAWPCSVLEIRDACNILTTTSVLRDFSNGLTKLSELGVQNLQFNGDNNLTQIYARGDAQHSFIRFKFKRHEQFDIIRINDNGNEAPDKSCGSCRKITKELLRDAKIFQDERLAKKTLDSFNLTIELMKDLLAYVLSNNNADYSAEKTAAYSTKTYGTAASNLPTTAEQTIIEGYSSPMEEKK